MFIKIPIIPSWLTKHLQTFLRDLNDIKHSAPPNLIQDERKKNLKEKH